ncbi:MAG: ABC transporter permease subunit [Planctomycetes bacterium]|nr:ABC transporter permease subunit [Planctomycetota bacterium]
MTGQPRQVWWLGGGVIVAVLLSLWLLPWNLETFASAESLGDAFDRVGRYLGQFLHPDLTAPAVTRAARLAADTVAVALLGVALGLLLAWPLAIGSSRNVVFGDEPPDAPGRFVRSLLLQGCRLLLDVLRGVPDFVWAILIANFTGTNAVTGMLAIALSVAGILGKVLGEQWDNVEPQRYAALRSTGAGRLAVFLYGQQPLAARAMLSFVLMRTECAVRNASVIGVVGGGGLGAGLWDDYTDGNWSRVATMLLAMLLVTATTDVAANLLRYQLRIDPNHPQSRGTTDRRTGTRRRLVGVGVVLALLSASVWWLWAPIARVGSELQRLEWGFIGRYTTGLLLPDLAPATLWNVAQQAVIPLGVGVLATVAATALAGSAAFFASIAFQIEPDRYTGERLPRTRRALRWVLVVGTRGLGLLLRGIPEVAWVILLSVFFRIGLTPCVLAVLLHSTGVLLRVFAETLDNVPYRRLEQIAGACRPQIFLYGALPTAWPDWRTYAFFQFEVNVRIGVVLGTVGAGGLGDKFQSNLLFREFARASTYLWAMVLLTIAIDRLSRRLLLRRLKC